MMRWCCKYQTVRLSVRCAVRLQLGRTLSSACREESERGCCEELHFWLVVINLLSDFRFVEMAVVPMMATMMVSFAVAGRYLMPASEPPSDPAADLELTVLAIVEDNALCSTSGGGGGGGSRPTLVEDDKINNAPGATAASPTISAGHCTEMHDDLKAAAQPVLHSAMSACSALLPIMSAP